MTWVQVKLISSMATREMLAELAQQFQEMADCTVAVTSAGGLDVAKRVRQGEPFDVVVLADNAIDTLVGAGFLAPGSRTDLVRSGISVAVALGAPQPDVSTEAALRRAVLAATSLGFSTGPSGNYLLKLFQRWGIYGEIQSRLVQPVPGIAVASLIARGEVELGFQQLSELMHMPGIAVLGPLPPAIQSITTFSAALAVASVQPRLARQLIDFLASPHANAPKLRHGMEPA
ncbi:MAG: substrate-binding domain-containing protein [Rhodoferax sp.]|nr:substrate-binding domain-containing protein [Rhodoferax sp.]